ncbi:cytochrome C family protein [Rhodopirellula islandica]|uniref:Cytochrome C family protein n=1 Tax=Rhodopirellula islandica TaxID=595434 RepID=A0A0J1BCQ2_RHOIS|nr:cytochrome c3 family protein [Rhodopirellula islandica]KLU04353.1 cytochrome C family protein [Rhodopirellula islandica]
MKRFLFPRWVNPFLGVLGLALVGGGVYAAAMGGLVTDPQTLNVGYQPTQPVPFSHALHAGQLKMDCRYCHNTVFDAAHAAVPPTATCVNCHSPAAENGQTPLGAVRTESAKLAPIHESWKTGRSVAWMRIHNLPEFVYFNHAAHVNSGVSCVSCHGRIDQMEVVYQHEQLSMAWCITCHRNPNEHLRPVELVTKLDWKADDHDWGEFANQEEFAKAHREEHNINPQVHCAVCHR